MKAVLDRLVQESEINPFHDEAYQLISSSHTVEVEKVRHLLDFLRMRSAEAFCHFQRVLCENECEDLVAKDNDIQQLEAELELLPSFEKLSLRFGIPNGVLKVRKQLHRSYLEAASEVHMMADVTSRASAEGLRDLKDVFVNIGLVSSDEMEKWCSEWTGKDRGVEEVLSKALEARPTDLHCLLKTLQRGHKDPVRVMALGAAGSGKSFTFTRKAPYDWSGGNLWEDIALLQTVRCRDKSVWRAKTISELFRLDDFGLSAREETEVRTFITEHPKHVVLVCDGLDEGRVDEGSLLWRIMRGDSLRGLRMVITSRPCRAAADLSQSGAVHQHVQLFGFSKDNMKQFVVKFLGKKRGGEMLAKLVKNPSISLLMHTPFFAVLVCEQYKEMDQLPKRRSDIFSSVLLRLVQRYARCQRLKANFKAVRNAPENLYKSVLEVGQMAFDRLKRKDLSFFELVEEDLSPCALELGFLEHMQATALLEEDQYGFRHLTLQEYLAALYVCSEVLKEAGDASRLVEELGCGQEAGHLNTFWVFVAGLAKESLLEELLGAISQIEFKILKESNGISADVDSAAAPGRAHAQVEEAHGQPKTTDQGNTGGRPDMKSGSKHQSQDDIHEPMDVYRFLLLLHCYQEGSGDKPSALVAHVLKRRGICCQGYLGLSHCDVDVMLGVIKRHECIVERVNIKDCHLGVDGLQHFLCGLLSCTHLKEFSIRSNFLYDEHMAVVSDIFTSNRLSLETVDLGKTGLGDEGLCRLADGLQGLVCRKRLGLSVVGLTSQSAGVLSAVISCQPAMVDCDLSYNSIGVEGFAKVHQALQECKQMEKLNLCGIGLMCHSSCTRALAATLANLPRLCELHLGDNDIQDEGFVQVAPLLQQCSRLHVLRLYSCGLTSVSMPLLVSVLLCLPSLERFSVGGNQIGDAGLNQLSVGLEVCSRLKELGLWGTGLRSSRSLSTAVSRLLRQLRRLEKLYLCGNRCDGSFTEVKNHPSLQVLWLPDSVSDDVLSQMKSLMDDPSCTLKEI